MPRLTDHQQTERRNQILVAAYRCFVRDGFHHTSMQAICREAGISPGGLYLYFASKEALIAGMIEKDRAELAEAFAAAAESDDVLAAMTEVGRHCFVDEPREKSLLTLQIWAEAARDPVIHAMCMAIEREVRDNLLHLCGKLREQGRVAPGVDLESTIDVVTAIGDGIFKSRALDNSFDGERALARMLHVFRAGLAGHLDRPTIEQSLELKT